MKFSEMDQKTQRVIAARLFGFAEVLRTIYLDCTERVIKVLLMLNSGGLITILAYLYKDKPPSSGYIDSLRMFLYGLCMVIVLVVADYLGSLCRLHFYTRDANEFCEDKRELEEISTIATKASAANILFSLIIIFFGALSLIFASKGIYTGYRAFMAGV